MSKQINYTITVYLRFLGLIATTLQLVQFFNGLWAFETWIEVSMLVLFLALAISPSKYLDKIVDAIASKIKGNKPQENDIFQASGTRGRGNRDIGGEDSNTNEEV